MSTGTVKRKNDRKGKGVPKLTTKRMVDFLLAMAESEDLQRRPFLYYTATKVALELGASQSKIDSLMMFYSDNLGHGNVVLGGFLGHIETLGPKASRKAKEAAVKSMVRVGAYRRARIFANKYLRRSLTQEEFTSALEVHCNGSTYSDEDDKKFIAWAAEFSQELADEIAAKLEARMKAAGYSHK